MPEAPPQARTRLEMPFLMLSGMGLSVFMAAVGAVAYGGIVLFAIVSGGPYTINGQSVDGGTFFRVMLPFWIGYPVALGAFGILAYGLWREQPWTPVAVMGFWFMLAAVTVVVQLLRPQPAADFLVGLAILLPGWAVAAWYFYRKRSVVTYYRVIAARAGTKGAAPK